MSINITGDTNLFDPLAKIESYFHDYADLV